MSLSRIPMERLLFRPLILFFLLSRVQATATTTPATSVSSPSSLSNSSNVVQIIETEQYINGTWTAAGWSDEAGKEVLAPSEYQLEPTESWSSDWNIAVSSASKHGWKYKYRDVDSPVLEYEYRKRIWLRSYQARRRSRLLSRFRDDWNFKGFGMTLYKSLLFPTVGVSIRLPLTNNFGFWERRPAFPVLSTSLAWFSPSTVVLFGNMSVRMEVIQGILEYLQKLVPLLLLFMLLTIFRGLALAVSVALFPITRKPLLVASRPSAAYQELVSLPPLQLSRSGEERLGLSWSYRLRLPSLEPHFRLSYWHYYDRQVSAVWNAPWVARRAAALGWSLSGPVPDDPETLTTASVLLSLSGLYLSNPLAQAI